MDTNSNLEKLEGFVCDEDRIVTIPWLCKILEVSAKDAKDLVNKYIKNNRKSQSGNLSVLYLLSGSRQNAFTISIAKEDELDEKKEQYNDPIVEVYGIQKAKVIDIDGIALVDDFNITEFRESPILGSITSRNCIKRIFKQGKVLPPPPAPTLKEKTSIFTKQPSNSTKVNNTSTVAINGNSVGKSTNTKTATKPKQSAFDRFFTSVDQKPIVKDSSTPLQKSVKDESSSQKKLTSIVDSDSDSETISQQHTESDNAKAKQSKRPAKKKKSSSKRRKRIVVEEESDDDIFGNDENNEEEEEELSRKRKNVITDSDEEQPVSKPEPVPEIVKSKKRKLVDRTFEDEEGFIITKKEWVEEVSSDKEETSTVTETKPDVPIKNENDNGNGNKAKENMSPKNEKGINGKVQGGKGKKAVPANQTTLMSFFKRK